MLTPDSIDWLASPAGEAALAAVTDDSRLATTINRLRKQLTAEQAHLVVEQWELRRRAEVKFPCADNLLFQRTLLEQASDWVVAHYKAARFPSGAACVDLCCGLGGDLLALAARGPTTGVDRSPFAVALARENCRRLGLASCHVIEADAADISVADYAAWHIDPDRRAGGKRTNLPELFEPPLRVLERLMKVNEDGAVKLGPATDAPSYWSEACEIEWLSTRGECRQQIAWFGTLARYPQQRTATALAADGTLEFQFVGMPHVQLPIAAVIGRYIYEPGAAVLAARLQGALGQKHGLSFLQPGIAYLTGDQRIEDPAIAGFEVLDQLPLDVKRLRGWLRERDIGRVEIKKRGIDIEPEQLRRSLKLAGDKDAVLLLTPHAGKHIALVAQRLQSG